MIGALLGGALSRYGERSHEQLQRQRQLEDYGRQVTLSSLLGHFEKNYENMLPEEQEAVLSQIESNIPGAKKGTLSPMIQGVRGFHSILPPPPQFTPPPQGRVSMEALPPPISAPIYQKMEGHTATLPSQTPNQVKAQRIAEQQARDRQRMIGEIGISPLPEEYKQMAIGGVYGVKGIPGYEVGMAGVNQRQAAADQRFQVESAKLSQFYGQPQLVKRGNENVFVWSTKSGPVTVDSTGKIVPFIPEPTDTIAPQVAQGRGSDFAQYIARMEAELGRPLTSAEVQQARSRFPDAPFVVKTKINGQDVELVTSRSKVLGANAPPGLRTGSGTAAATPTTPRGKGAAATKKSQPSATTSQINPVPNVGGLVFPSQTSAAEDKVGDEYEQSFRKVGDVETMASSEFMGAVRGGTIDYALRSKFPELANWLGRPGISAQEATFRAMNESMRNSIIHLLSGAAVSPAEEQRIMGELPDPSSPGNWEGKVLTTKRNAAYLLNRIRERQGKPGVPLPELPTAGPTIIDNRGGVESPEARKQRLRERYGVR